MIKDTIQQAAAVAEQLRRLAKGGVTIAPLADGRWEVESPALRCGTCRHALTNACEMPCIACDDHDAWEAKS